MSKIISIINQKGGVGKTTTAVNLGVALANEGKRVLLIDLDSQANLTISLGFDADELEYTTPVLLDKKINDYNYKIERERFILRTEEGVDIIPSDIRLSAIETKMLNVINRESILKNLISGLKDEYDYILIDCLPSLGILNVNALVAADSVIIPVEAQILSIRGIELLIPSILNIKAQINHTLEIEGILITKYDKRTKLSKEVKKFIDDVYSDNVKVFENKINISTKIAEAPSEGQSIFKYMPNCEVAKNYEQLAKEVISNE